MLGAGVSYVYADHLDTPRLITRSSYNAIVWRWDVADPFGVQPPQENPTGAGAFTYNLRFPGQLFDRETNNHYNYYRDYDPQTGRYVQSDPIGLSGGINTFVYANSNRISRIDSLGLLDEVNHKKVTNAALTEIGWPKYQREEISQLVADVDILPGSQLPDAEHSPWHAMCAPNQSMSDSERRREALTSVALATCNRTDLAKAMHAAQDSAAGGHKQCQVWNGHVSFSHLKADMFPSKVEFSEAQSKSADLIRKFQQKCDCGK